MNVNLKRDASGAYYGKNAVRIQKFDREKIGSNLIWCYFQNGILKGQYKTLKQCKVRYYMENNK